MKPKAPRRWKRWFRRGLLTAAIGIITVYALFTGPHDFPRYPGRATSLYLLPWSAGASHWCMQGNRGVVSHRTWEEFAYDFKMPVGTDVCAARGGFVAFADVSHDGHGLHEPNNCICIDHGDGTRASYLHLQKGGSYVRTGERVAQGQRIGASGNVGRSTGPHLHFQVTGHGGATIPVTFADVTQDRGIPRMFFCYTSQNHAPSVQTAR